MEQLPEPHVNFNYQGQFTGQFADSALFASPEDALASFMSTFEGVRPSERPQRREKERRRLSVTPLIHRDQMRIPFKYSPHVYRQEAIADLADRYVEAVRGFLDD
jgi:hypothetical protein